MCNRTSDPIIVSISATTCRCCGQPLESRYRAPEHRTSAATGKAYTVPAQDALTCKNATCTLYMQTYDSRDYATIDLSIYGFQAVR